ncbi:hypothetical protein WICMUC_003040 [Wickerhamomyces mucosus]|uniref:Copper transport protein n=1 Tax=Wickerhamomyces mucosus TaxID=1378264 RepID=A0A9P8PMK3_9ASCO|nr:hypothetical protein WICMUC_003040 [Wickerhamomyces mucosus]
MATSTSTASSMDMDMSMNTALTTSYKGYPVIFATLSAANGGQAFAIFIILFFTGFTFRGISFLQSYIEQKIFKQPLIIKIIPNDGNLIKDEIKSETLSFTSDDDDNNNNSNNNNNNSESNKLRKLHSNNHYHHDDDFNEIKQRSILAKFFNRSLISYYQDFIRLILTFIQVMVGYSLMLSVMTFIIPYFFAVILGISIGEVFFHRLSICMDILASGDGASLH